MQRWGENIEVVNLIEYLISDNPAILMEHALILMVVG